MSVPAIASISSTMATMAARACVASHSTSSNGSCRAGSNSIVSHGKLRGRDRGWRRSYNTARPRARASNCRCDIGADDRFWAGVALARLLADSRRSGTTAIDLRQRSSGSCGPGLKGDLAPEYLGQTDGLGFPGVTREHIENECVGGVRKRFHVNLVAGLAVNLRRSPGGTRPSQPECWVQSAPHRSFEWNFFAIRPACATKQRLIQLVVS